MVRDLSECEVEEPHFARGLLHRAAAEQTRPPLSDEVLTGLKQMQSCRDAAIREKDRSETFRRNGCIPFFGQRQRDKSSNQEIQPYDCFRCSI